MNIIIAPSLLAANFCNLEKQIKEVEAAGADWLHLDVMDGHFVPNITFGPPLVEAIRKCSKLPLDVHLMIENAEKYLSIFRSAGADNITVHLETCPDLNRVIRSIKKLGAKAGVSIKPATPVKKLKDFIKSIDLVLVMTVEPGFGGQRFMNNSINRIRAVREMIDAGNKKVYLEVDGGIDPVTASRAIKAGANVIVAGTSIFRSTSIKKAISSFRNKSA